MSRIDVAALSRKNLNLLIVFNVVAELRSATLGAERLSLTQSAMSHSIGRLRELFDDPLFIRGRAGFILTDRAEALVGPVGELLLSMEELLQTETFDPASTDRTFRISLSECCFVPLGSEVIREVRRLAPNAKIAVETLGPDSEQCLVGGRLDIAIWHSDLPIEPLCSMDLFRDRFVGLIHGEHPLAPKARAGRIRLEDYLAFPHVETLLHGVRQDPIRSALKRIGSNRSIAISTKTFAPSFSILVGTPLIGTIPSGVALAARNTCTDLLVFELPFSVDDLPYRMVWHPRTGQDSAVTWLRTLFAGFVPRDTESIVEADTSAQQKLSRTENIARPSVTSVKVV